MPTKNPAKTHQKPKNPKIKIFKSGFLPTLLTNNQNEMNFLENDWGWTIEAEKIRTVKSQSN